MTKENLIVPVVLKDSFEKQPSSLTQKPKLACQLKIDNTELRVYNGANQYILTSILKELYRVD